MPKKKDSSKKRRFFLIISLLSIFTLSSVIGTAFLQAVKESNQEKLTNDNSEITESIGQKTLEILGSPFRDLLSVTKKTSKKEPKDVAIKIPILMYHYVEYVTDERDTIRQSLNIEPHVFEQQLVTLKNAGYTFIWTSELEEIIKNKKLQDKKYVIITFDDGYKDFYTDAYPILKKHNVKAVNYVSYYFLDTPNYMDTTDIEEIVKSNLVEFGSHTLTHVDITTLSKKDALDNLIKSKKYLESKFGIEVKSFAYPYGFWLHKCSYCRKRKHRNKQ